jgi:alpha-D-ribose 1-methylphosphonate 5-phosphate C-P lyase
MRPPTRLRKSITEEPIRDPRLSNYLYRPVEYHGIARGWGTGGLQVTLTLFRPGSVVKVIDQSRGADGVNAANLRRFIARMSGGAHYHRYTARHANFQSATRSTQRIMREKDKR